MIIKREIQTEIEKSFSQGRAVIIYGPRRVGKTTLVKELQKKYSGPVYLDCDEPDIRKRLTDKTSTELREFIGNTNLVFIDEAQRVKNIGLTIKLLVDNFPKLQVVATGSSSFELSNSIVEPLTGRKYEFYLYPLSIKEIMQVRSFLELDRTLETRIIYGMYPEVFQTGSDKILKELVRSYLFRDIFQFQDIKNPEVLDKLLSALALQVGNEVSYNELANLVEIDKKTVARYIQILEKAFIIFRIRPYSRNLRKEISKLRKIYFWDTGIRNALIKNLNPLNLRQDVGSLWENFVIAERIKHNSNCGVDKNYYFWRTHRKEEIDFIEESEGSMTGFEIKWNKARLRIPKAFSQAYPDTKVELVTKDNYLDFLTK